MVILYFSGCDGKTVVVHTLGQIMHIDFSVQGWETVRMLESYVTPLLMSYVNRYIKNLKPSDLQLSLWGGDVVLSKLDLKLDVLEQVRNFFLRTFVNKL